MESNQDPHDPKQNALHFRYRILFTPRKDGERQKENLAHLKCKCANNDDKHGGQESARSVLHLARLFILADQAGVLCDPDRAVARMRIVLALAGIEE